MEKREAGMSKGKRVTITTARRVRMRRLALVMAVAMASGRAYALGMGDLELHSALNQPLNAEVRLLVNDPKELDGASVLLAPNDDFVRAFQTEQQLKAAQPIACHEASFAFAGPADFDGQP